MRTERQGGKPCHHHGFTLIEQVMVLAIIGVLVSVALPPLHHLLTRNAVQGAQTDFIAALRHARATAATSGKRTVFCPSVDGTHCTPTTHWESGWLLGIDTDHDNQPDGAPRYTGASQAGTLHIRSSIGRQWVRFLPDGSAPGSNLTLLFCALGGETPALSVVVSNSGRIRGAPASAEQAAACVQGNSA